MNGYGLGDTIKNSINYVYTKLFWKEARFVRLPIIARNKKNINISSGFTCGSNCRLNPGTDGTITISGGTFTHVETDGNAPEKLSDSDLRNMMRDPKYWRDHDAEYIRKIENGFKKLYS